MIPRRRIDKPRQIVTVLLHHSAAVLYAHQFVQKRD
jgi:hypothetical protein